MTSVTFAPAGEKLVVTLAPITEYGFVVSVGVGLGCVVSVDCVGGGVGVVVVVGLAVGFFVGLTVGLFVGLATGFLLTLDLFAVAGEVVRFATVLSGFVAFEESLSSDVAV